MQPTSSILSSTVQRVASVDACRGFVMLLMLAEVLSFHHVSEAMPNSSFWKFLSYQQEHVEWWGCSLHDLIQPSFTFLVGVSLPFSIAGRQARGDSFREMLLTAIKRSFILVMLGIFLRSMPAKQTYFTFEDTLTQIGLGYTFLFLLGFQTKRVQVMMLIAVLIAYWAAFISYPLPPANFDYTAVGVPATWEYHSSGIAAHWNKNSNLAWAFDRWFLNLFPREKPFSFSYGGYSTLSFIPTIGTMILGLFAGNILRSETPGLNKAKRFTVIGISLLILATLIHFAGINPIVKRIWTPAWVLFSGGWCFLIFAFFYLVIDIFNYRKWAFFLLVIGANSITAYVLAGSAEFVGNTLKIHLGQHYHHLLGSVYSTLVGGALILFVQWLILYWMYRKKIFIKI